MKNKENKWSKETLSALDSNTSSNGTEGALGPFEKLFLLRAERGDCAFVKRYLCIELLLPNFLSL